MSQIIDAIYEAGVLKPLEPLHLKEHAKVRIQISTTEQEQQPIKPLDSNEIEEILALARASYEGLSEEEISMIESARFDNTHFVSDSGESK
ncbi:antitoxin family protein [Candidatus Poribacteria bacterium]|nr:antitoxin family protein [Candidatus Poribacteria bacterium]